MRIPGILVFDIGFYHENYLVSKLALSPLDMFFFDSRAFFSILDPENLTAEEKKLGIKGCVKAGEGLSIGIVRDGRITNDVCGDNPMVICRIPQHSLRNRESVGLNPEQRNSPRKTRA